MLHAANIHVCLAPYHLSVCVDRKSVIQMYMCLFALEQPYSAAALESFPPPAAKTRNQYELIAAADHTDLQYSILGIRIGRKAETAAFKRMDMR